MSLEGWNLERRRAWDAKLLKVQHPELVSNGLACPQCGVSSLYDTGRVWPGPPSRMVVKCMSNCGFKGEKVE